MKLQADLRRVTRAFVKSGGKKNRKMQLKRMEAFVSHCRAMGCVCLHRAGNRHVMSYYETIEHLADSTVLNHYYAIRLLMRLSLLPDPQRPPSLSNKNKQEVFFE